MAFFGHSPGPSTEASLTSAAGQATAVRTPAQHATQTPPQPTLQLQPAEKRPTTNIVLISDNMQERREYWNEIEKAFPHVRVHPLLARGYGNFVETIIDGQRIFLLLVLEKGGLKTVLEATKSIRSQARPAIDHIVHDLEQNPLEESTRKLIAELGLDSKVRSIQTRETIRKHLISWLKTVMPPA